MHTEIARIAAQFPSLSSAGGAPEIVPVQAGLINDTYRVNGEYILQRLHPLFAPTVNLDIEALTPVLRAHGVPVPTLQRTRAGALWVEEDGRSWRAMNVLPGNTHHRVVDAQQAYEASRALGAFHSALRGTSHVFHFSRPGAHDTLKHMRTLKEALQQHPGHRLFAEVRHVAMALFDLWSSWGELPSLPLRLVHGDPKISNLLFDERFAVTGVVDLDTMAWETLQVEIGDALRSWCNQSTEDDARPSFDLSHFEGALRGYLSETRDWITPEEIAAIPGAASRICMELCARFAADALRESYFGWDPSVAPTRGEHNLLRARAQLLLAEDATRQQSAMQAIVQSSL